MRRRIVCFGGSSVATSLFVRRRMNGLMRRISCRRAHVVAVLLDRRAEALGEIRVASPSSPGIRKANCDHSSSRLFSIGVPERHSRWPALSWHTARVALASGLLMACASSSTTMCQALVLHRLDIAREHHVGGDHDMDAGELAAALVAIETVQDHHPQDAARTSSVRRSSSAPGWSARRSAPAAAAGLSACSTTIWAMVCAVLPSPMSSARKPHSPCTRRCCSQSTPCCW